MFPPWGSPKPPQSPRELLLARLRDGVPPELACRAAGVTLESLEGDPEAEMARAEGEIMLYERARDSGVTGIVRANMRYEAKSWQPKAEGPGSGTSLEDLLKD